VFDAPEEKYEYKPMRKAGKAMMEEELLSPIIGDPFR